MMPFAVFAFCIGMFCPVIFMFLARFFALVTFVTRMAFDTFVALPMLLAVSIARG